MIFFIRKKFSRVIPLFRFPCLLILATNFQGTQKEFFTLRSETFAPDRNRFPRTLQQFFSLKWDSYLVFCFSKGSHIVTGMRKKGLEMTSKLYITLVKKRSLSWKWFYVGLLIVDQEWFYQLDKQIIPSCFKFLKIFQVLLKDQEDISDMKWKVRIVTNSQNKRKIQHCSILLILNQQPISITTFASTGRRTVLRVDLDSKIPFSFHGCSRQTAWPK